MSTALYAACAFVKQLLYMEKVYPLLSSRNNCAKTVNNHEKYQKLQGNIRNNINLCNRPIFSVILVNHTYFSTNVYLYKRLESVGRMETMFKFLWWWETRAEANMPLEICTFRQERSINLNLLSKLQRRTKNVQHI